MRQSILIICSLLTLNLLGQNLTSKVGEIEIQLVSHHYKRNSDYELTRKKSNKRNRPYSKKFFNSKGVLLKTISFGKQHNIDLRLINKINIYHYEQEKVTTSIEYESDYQRYIYPYWKTKYLYNSLGELIDESTYYYKSDSLFQRMTYEYDLNSNKVKSILNPSYFYKREYDSENKLLFLKQIYEDSLRWEWTYKYENNMRIGTFQTYYKNGENHSKIELKTFNSQGQLIEFEEKYTSNLEFGEKIKYYYGKYGLLKKVEYYNTDGIKNEYKIISYTNVKLKSKTDIDFELSEKINNQLELIK